MKATMSGQRIPFMARVRSAYNIYQGHRTGQFANTNVNSSIEVHQSLCRLFAQYDSTPISQAHILDLGCGQNAVQTVLFHADGAKVTGIDVEVPALQMNWQLFVKTAKLNGLERAFKSLARNVLFDKKFFHHLAEHYPKPISFDDLDLRIMDAKKTMFPHNHFDFIFSLWVFEHVDDVDAVVQEVNRVLKPTGVAFIELHLFPSLSGGHNLEWLNPDTSPSRRVPPWDHLRDNNFPANVYLNKLRLSDYRQIFHTNIEVVEEQLNYEGETILTVELEDLLRMKSYSRDDLLTRSVGFVCRKRNHGLLTRPDNRL